MILIAYILDFQISYLYIYQSVISLVLGVSFHLGFIVHLKLGLSGTESACNCKDPLVKMVKKIPTMRRLMFDPWSGKILWRSGRAHSNILLLENSMDKQPDGLESMRSQSHTCLIWQ